MLKHWIFVVTFSIPMVTVVLADTTIVIDNFQSYATDAAMRSQWVSSSSSSESTFLFDATTPGQPYPVSPALGAVDGKAVLFDGSAGVGANSVNRWATPISVGPSATQNLELSADLAYDDLLYNKKLSLGLRYTDGATLENVIELGFWNNFPDTPSLQFAHRATLMPGGNNWAPYGLAASIARVGDMPNEGLGFHRFTAVIGLANIVFSLDLFNDGRTNLTGLPGIDAQDTVAASVTANGFNDLRFGVPSATGSSTNPWLAVDNVSLRLVDIPDPFVGDYNSNDVVDAGDYVVWRETLGQMDDGNGLHADGDQNGFVDALDYLVWRKNFGRTPAGSSATAANETVPEPATIVLLLFAAAAFSRRMASTRKFSLLRRRSKAQQ